VARYPGGGKISRRRVTTNTALGENPYCIYCLAVGMAAQVPCPGSVSLRMFTLNFDLANLNSARGRDLMNLRNRQRCWYLRCRRCPPCGHSRPCWTAASAAGHLCCRLGPAAASCCRRHRCPGPAPGRPPRWGRPAACPCRALIQPQHPQGRWWPSLLQPCRDNRPAMLQP
jgi:hypothetical protein